MTIYEIHAYITLMNWSYFCVTLCYDCDMMNRIRHNYPSLIRCLRVFHILVYAYLLFRCYYYNHYKIPKTLLLLSLLLLPLPLLSYYFATKHFAVDTKFPGVVELRTQLLILENILWLPLCRINKFGWILYPRKLLRSPILVGYQHAMGLAKFNTSISQFNNYPTSMTLTLPPLYLKTSIKYHTIQCTLYESFYHTHLECLSY